MILRLLFLQSTSSTNQSRNEDSSINALKSKSSNDARIKFSFLISPSVCVLLKVRKEGGKVSNLRFHILKLLATKTLQSRPIASLQDDLGSPFTMYRGQDLSEEVGMSWTLSRDKAEWFAQRNADHIDKDGETGVIEMQVTVSDILFHDNSREELEVVIDPNLVLFSLSPKEEQQYNNSSLPSPLAI